VAQHKNNTEKRIARLTEELAKEVSEREELAKDSGEAKRELARLKLGNSDLHAQLDLQLESQGKQQQQSQSLTK
jgi:hypothetical protein